MRRKLRPRLPEPANERDIKQRNRFAVARFESLTICPGN
jgi:hypothetical protein